MNPPQPLDLYTIQGNDTYLNSVFGLVQLTAPQNPGESPGVNILPGSVENYIRREFGTTTQVNKMNKTIDALTNPRVYLQNSARDLIRISDMAAQRYKSTYGNALQRGLPEDKCVSMARSAAKHLYDEELKIHNQTFPDEITNKVVKNLKH